MIRVGAASRFVWRADRDVMRAGWLATLPLLRSGIALCLAGFWPVAPVAAQRFLEDPARFWQHESEYAGAQACETCHADIFDVQQRSNHALSLHPAREVPQLTAGMPAEKVDPVSQARLRIGPTADGGVQLSAWRGEDRASLTLDWAFGSGLKGITAIGRSGDGEFVESSLTWYASLSAFDLTTGATQYERRTVAEGLGRRLSRQEVAECFGCHTTGYDSRRQAPARKEMGVRCERCHGPGAEHVRSAASGSVREGIFHPGKLEPFAQVQMCGACHGTPPQDNDLDAIRYVETTLKTVRFPSQRLVLSRCFNESMAGLKCITCHDPHTNAEAERVSHDRSCLSCHAREDANEGSTCPVAAGDCASCHMPRERVMSHSLFTDHWIRVIRSAQN